MTSLPRAESLRDWLTVTTPDPRMCMGEGEIEREALLRRQEAIAQLTLNASVPEDVRIHYETAKNVLLYAWFVYRFHMVAEQYVLSSLELAL